MKNFLIDEVNDLLSERRLEVERHLRFAKALVDSKANAIAHVSATDRTNITLSDYKIDRSLIKTISATGYLLIYNLLESTMTAAFDAVHKQLKNDGITFEELNSRLQKICMTNFKGAINQESIKDFQTIAINSVLVSFGYNSKKLWSGNVDAKNIKQKAKEYGIEVVYKGEDYKDLTRNLRTVKEKRNALAHGSLSFEQCGQDTAVDALIEYSQQANAYLLAVLEGLDIYLEEKRYSVSA